MDQTTWKKVLDTLRPVRASVEILLRSAKPLSFDGNDLKIGVYYRFHKEKLEELKNKQILESVLRQVFEKDIKMCCVLSKLPDQVATETVNVVEPRDDLSVIAEEIFTI